MFDLFRDRRLQRHTQGVRAYLEFHYMPQSDNIRYSDRDPGGGILYSDRGGPADRYDPTAVASLLRSGRPYASLGSALGQVTDLTFTDKLILHIRRKGLRDPQVYKAARLDRKLFSKIMSDRHYKPSKDTAIALAMALRLDLEEARDLLSRAGYTLSHSSKRDIIIEYFFREREYRLDDMDQILYDLGEKVLGR